MKQFVAKLALLGSFSGAQAFFTQLFGIEDNATVLSNIDLPWITQTKTDTSKCYNSYKRLMREGDKRIKYPAGTEFSDISFPADSTAISWNKPVSSKIIWKRVRDLEKTPGLWGSKGILTAAVNQGGLGDCWFLSTGAAIAENPDRIKKVFNGITDYPSNGQFVFQFWNKQDPVYVTIDDKIPGKMYWGTTFWPEYARKSKNGAWWVPILEKAAAKFFGNYRNMEGGWMDEAIQAMTGMPTRSIANVGISADKMWAFLQEWEKENYIMTASIDGNNIDLKGLVNNHAYTILGTGSIGSTRLVKMRNPWGSEDYIGTWSDKDKSKWTKENQKILNHTPTMLDGVFFLPIEDFLKFYTMTIVGYYKDWKMTKKDMIWDRKEDINWKVFKINNQVAQDIHVGFAYAMPRMFIGKSKCHAPERMESFWFYFNKAGDPNFYTPIKDATGAKYKFTGTNSMKTFYFKNLPKGTYRLIIGRTYKPKSKGKMPYSAVTYGTNQAPEISLD